MKNKKVRLAVLGTGPRWQSLENVYPQHEQVEVVALCDHADGLAEASAKRLYDFNGATPEIYRSYEEMIKSAKYDAVFITCDPDVQVDFAVNEMNRGIHVMTEVPAAYTMKQCHDLVNTVKKTGVKYQLAEQTRYWQFIKIWREMAAQGKFGKIYYAEGEYLHYEPKWDFFKHKTTGHHLWTDDASYHDDDNYEPTWRYRISADPIFYLPHTLSPLLSITGGRIDSVSCLGSAKGDSCAKGFKSRAIECALMHNSNDAIFSVRTGNAAPYGLKRGTGAHWYQIKGTERSVEWARSVNDYPKEYSLADGWVEHPEWGCIDPDAPEEFKRALHGGTDYYPIYYFVDAIINDKTPPMDVYLAVETAAPAIAAAESANKGGIKIEIPDFR